MKEKMKNKGITLIALIITIILLLILAGITISQLSGNGIFEKSKEAKQKYESAQELENNILEKYENQIDYLSGINRETPVENYTSNLIYQLNLENLNNQTDVTIVGSGVQVSDNKKYVSLDGASGIEISDSTIDPDGTVKNNADKTMCCWYNKKGLSISSNEMIMYFGQGSAGIWDHYLMFSGNSNIGLGHTNATITKLIDPADRSDNEWHFVAAVFKNNNEATFYYDGVPFSTTGSYVTNGSVLHIGYYRDNQYFKGDLADVRLYNSALTKANIKQIYAYGKQYLGIK